MKAGTLDRRIRVEVAASVQDDAGQWIKGPWTLYAERWAKREDNTGRLFRGAQEIIRDIDTLFTLRNDSQSAAIAPETHRIVCDNRIYRIVSIGQGKVRHDELLFLCSTRPDASGARGPVT